MIGTVAVVLVREFWTLLSPSNVVTTCALYRTPAGLELRAGHGEADILLQQNVLNDTIATAYADGWKVAALVCGREPLTPLKALIVNTESEPVPVSLAAASSEPFQEHQIADAPFAFHVPADKKAIVKCVTGVCRYGADDVRNGVILRVNGGRVNLAGNTPFKLESGPNAGSYLVNFPQQVLMTALPGSSVFIDIPPAPSVGVAFLSGDLVPAD